eukprot:scaffold66232_cov18-Tisochrysis_lutea.AAC.2
MKDCRLEHIVVTRRERKSKHAHLEKCFGCHLRASVPMPLRLRWSHGQHVTCSGLQLSRVERPVTEKNNGASKWTCKSLQSSQNDVPPACRNPAHQAMQQSLLTTSGCVMLELQAFEVLAQDFGFQTASELLEAEIMTHDLATECANLLALTLAHMFGSITDAHTL